MIKFLKFKAKSPIFLRSGIIYKFWYGDNNATYCAKTKRHFKDRMCEHPEFSAPSRERVKGDNKPGMKKYDLFRNRSSGIDNFFILASNSNDFKVTLMEDLQ